MSSELQKRVFWIGALLIVLGGVWFLFSFKVWTPSVQTLKVRIGEHTILVEVADSAEERSTGLSGRDGLEEGRGMIFLFPESAVQRFWMKEMKFPIDIIWVRDGRVVGFEEDVPVPAAGVSESELPVYFSPEAVDMVLEVSAGTVYSLGIQVGDKFEVVI